jgi:RNA polymerase sigma-70 factor, ECF subfamily
MLKKDKSATDEEVVLKVTSGDVDSFGELMKRYEQKLLRYVIYLTGGQISSVDVVQDTFIKAYVNLRGFNPKYKFSSWIYRIAHNEAMNAIKKERRLVHDVDFDGMKDEHDDLHPAVKLDKVVMNRGLWACLNQLDEKYREILILQYFENMKYSEISDVLRMPVSTVGVRSSRAKEKLKRICLEKGVKYE